MPIASALRRKQDQIAATIAAYEARIDAARTDLAAIEQAARLFDPEAERAETAIPLAMSQSDACPRERRARATTKIPLRSNPLALGSRSRG
jgi:hypothetical protein